MNKKDAYSEQISNTSIFPSRPTQAIIDLEAYKNNLVAIKEKVNKKTMAIVKADAYGHGLIPISKAAEDIVDFFGVAILEEAISLRENNISKPILVLGYIDPKFFPIVAAEDIRLSIFSYEQWSSWKIQSKEQQINNKVHVHIKINSGMNRLGFKNKEEMDKVIKEINQSPHFEIEGIFTHFATADSINDEQISSQEDFFLNMTKHLNNNQYIFHIANSAYTLTRQSDLKFDMVRLGISSYGLLPDPSLENEVSIQTKPILQLKTEIVHIQHIEPGDRVGYGGTYKANKKEKIGIIPIGYADGFLRRYSQESYVLINNEKRKIIGRICMDQAMVLLNDQDKIGDEVVIYGKQGCNEITIDQAAKWSNTINYEITCLISQRVHKKYICKN